MYEIWKGYKRGCRGVEVTSTDANGVPDGCRDGYTNDGSDGFADDGVYRVAGRVRNILFSSNGLFMTGCGYRSENDGIGNCSLYRGGTVNNASFSAYNPSPPGPPLQPSANPRALPLIPDVIVAAAAPDAFKSEPKPSYAVAAFAAIAARLIYEVIPSASFLLGLSSLIST
jgi:hypothetical protein